MLPRGRTDPPGARRKPRFAHIDFLEANGTVMIRKATLSSRCSMRFFCKLILTVLLVAAVARAQTPSPEAAKAEPSAAAPAAAPAAPAADQARPYVDSALTFLKAYTHTNRTGPEGEKAWADLRSVS